jgi:hypothetical protein
LLEKGAIDHSSKIEIWPEDLEGLGVGAFANLVGKDQKQQCWAVNQSH